MAAFGCDFEFTADVRTPVVVAAPASLFIEPDADPAAGMWLFGSNEVAVLFKFPLQGLRESQVPRDVSRKGTSLSKPTLFGEVFRICHQHQVARR